MITGIHHFSIACSDAERSSAFYCDLFGLELVSDREIEAGGFVEKVTGVPGANVRIVHMSGYGANFELLEYKAPRGDPRARAPNHAGSAHLCFVVDDIDATFALLTESGVISRSVDGPVTLVGGPNEGGKAVYLEDPDGNQIELVQLVRPWPTVGV